MSAALTRSSCMSRPRWSEITSSSRSPPTMMTAESSVSGRADQLGLGQPAGVDQADEHLGEALERRLGLLGPRLAEAGQLADEAAVQGRLGADVGDVGVDRAVDLPAERLSGVARRGDLPHHRVVGGVKQRQEAGVTVGEVLIEVAPAGPRQADDIGHGRVPVALLLDRRGHGGDQPLAVAGGLGSRPAGGAGGRARWADGIGDVTCTGLTASRSRPARHRRPGTAAAGIIVTLRIRGASGAGSGAIRSIRRAIASSTTRCSAIASVAPRQRRMPPPNGIQV